MVLPLFLLETPRCVDYPNLSEKLKKNFPQKPIFYERSPLMLKQTNVRNRFQVICLCFGHGEEKKTKHRKF